MLLCGERKICPRMGTEAGDALTTNDQQTQTKREHRLVCPQQDVEDCGRCGNGSNDVHLLRASMDTVGPTRFPASTGDSYLISTLIFGGLQSFVCDSHVWEGGKTSSTQRVYK